MSKFITDESEISCDDSDDFDEEAYDKEQIKTKYYDSVLYNR